MTRVVVIGVDAATYDLVELWKEYLPNIKEIINYGTFGVLRSTIPPDSSPAWACFSTGKNPGNIGIYGFLNVNPFTKEITIVDSTSCKSQTIWEILSQFGKRVCVLNVPFTYPPREVNGYFVSGFPTPFTRKDYTHPRDLYEELDNLVCGYQTDIIYSTTNEAGEEKFLVELSKVYNRILRTAKYLYKKEKWDFFMVVFREIDYVQHCFWKYMNSEDQGEKYADMIKEWYIRIDKAIGEIRQELDNDTILVIMSDHGMEDARFEFCINEWLRRHGLLKFLPGSQVRTNLDTQWLFRFRMLVSKHLPSRLVKMLLAIIPQPVLIRVSRQGRTKQDIEKIFSSVDWSRTKAWGLGGTNAAVYINSRNENSGNVKDTSESIMKQVIEELKNLPTEIDRDVIANVARKEDIYRGKHVDMAPDLMVDLHIEHSKCYVSSKTSHKMISSEKNIVGKHCPRGIWLSNGPGIKRNVHVNADIVDLAPTLLYLLNIPIPDDMDGEIVWKALYLSRKPKYQKSIGASTKRKSVLSDPEKDELKKRLKGLGYLG